MPAGSRRCRRSDRGSCEGRRQPLQPVPQCPVDGCSVWLRSSIEIRIDGPLVSRPYVNMTLAVMRDFGVTVDEPAEDVLSIAPQSYRGRPYEIEPDASAASYFFAAAAITGGRVTVDGLTARSLQGDLQFVDVLEKMGCDVERGSGSVTVTGGPLRGVDVDMNALSDTAQTLAAVAPFAEGRTIIRNVAHMRHKETDRVGAVVTELRKTGAHGRRVRRWPGNHPRPTEACHHPHLRRPSDGDEFRPDRAATTGHSHLRSRVYIQDVPELLRRPGTALRSLRMTGSGGNRPPSRPASVEGTIGRRIAFEAISAFHERQAFVHRVVENRAPQLRASPADRSFALDLATGVVRRQATLDALLPTCVDRPRSEVETPLWTLLQLGAYQLALTDIPTHAAVSATVEIAKQIHRPVWARFVNGVLRAFSEIVTPEITDQAGPDCVPLPDGRYRRIRRSIFPDPTVDAALYLTKAHSYPRWLIREWLTHFGEPETTRLCGWFNRAPALTLRVNLLRQSRDGFLSHLADSGVEASAGASDESIQLTHSANVSRLPGFTEGWFSVQDESAMAAARLLAPSAGESILDLCAAPGGKTTHLAELMRDDGRIVAVDVDAQRLETVVQNAARLGLVCIQPVAVSAAGDGLPSGPFDAALVDVPCSNTGVLGKRPEARWRITSSGIVSLIDTQRRLLQQAIERVRAGGRVVYSTCSIDPRENRQLVDSVVDADRSLQILRDVTHVPGRPGDGGYQALIQCGR